MTKLIIVFSYFVEVLTTHAVLHFRSTDSTIHRPIV